MLGPWPLWLNSINVYINAKVIKLQTRKPNDKRENGIIFSFKLVQLTTKNQPISVLSFHCVLPKGRGVSLITTVFKKRVVYNFTTL